MSDAVLGTPLAGLDTPCAVVDAPRLDRNLSRMAGHLRSLGVAFRPHVKTHKCLAVAERQRALGSGGITVSTLKEAEQFFDGGFDDILYAVCIDPTKLPRAQALHRRGCRLQVVVDSLAAARALVERAPELPVLIEVDVDGHRSGVAPDAPELLAIGQALQQGGATLAGVMTHAGSSYDLSDPVALAALAEQERARCVHAAERLRAAGLPCPVVSVGSTPTALSARRLDGVTEVRAGVYAFFDLVMSGVGVCTPDDVALSVLCTVIGHQADKGWAVVDAGWMATSRDRGTARQARDCGYGLVCDLRGRLIPDLQMTGANQEHGLIASADGSELSQRLPLGTRLRILPNHACATAAQHDHYVLAEGDRALDRWPRFGGW